MLLNLTIGMVMPFHHRCVGDMHYPSQRQLTRQFTWRTSKRSGGYVWQSTILATATA